MNPHQFSFVDPETKVSYVPAHTMKVVCPKGSWLAGQMAAGVIVTAPDPAGVLPKAAAPPASVPSVPAKPSGRP